MPATGNDSVTYTIYGTPADLTALAQRRNSGVFTWDEDLLLFVNHHVLTVYHQAFDLTSLNDLDPTLFAFHVSQIFAVLLYDRVQIAKTDILHNASALGSNPVQTGRHVSQLIRDIYIYVFIANVLSDSNQPMNKFDAAYTEQVLDGLHCSADAVRTAFSSGAARVAVPATLPPTRAARRGSAVLTAREGGSGRGAGRGAGRTAPTEFRIRLTVGRPTFSCFTRRQNTLLFKTVLNS